MGLHSTRSNTTAMHGIVKSTVANAAALAAVTPSAAELADRAVWLQTDTRQLWVPKSTTAGDFEPFLVLGQTPGAPFPGPNSYVDIFEDFITMTSAPSNSVNTVLPSGYNCVAIGTGVGAILTSTALERGYLQFSTGAGTTGQYGFTVGGGNNKCFAVQQSDYAALQTRRQDPSAVSDGTNTYTEYFGLSDSSTSIGTNALVVQHDKTVDATHWVALSKVGGTPNNIVSTVAINPGQIRIHELVKPAGSNTWTYYIDGVSVGSTANNPTAAMCLVDYVQKTAGTTPVTFGSDFGRLILIQPGKRGASFLA